MNKRIICFLFALVMTFSLIMPAYAVQDEEVTPETEEIVDIPVKHLTISTLDDFLEFARNCRIDSYSQNLEVKLETDIDLSGISFAGIPIFCGTFLGRSHTISGISITSDGSYQGLFRYLTSSALVRDLTVAGEIAPDGTQGYVGSVAGSNAGTIEHCKFVGAVSGGDYVGGIAGVNTVTGTISWCNVEGEVFGDHFVGGIAGENQGVIHKCINWAKINFTPKQNTVDLSDITLDALANSESANTVTDVGGIAGLSSGVIRNCDNRGDVGYKLMGYNIGGIAGTQVGYISNSKNYMTVNGRKETGGIVGQMEPVTQIEFTQDTLQILREQLNSMSGIVSQVSGNAQSNASQITGQIGVLQSQVQTAKDAVESLYSDGSFPDADKVLAAQGTLSKTLQSMPSTMSSIASATQATIGGLSRDLQALSGHISAMGQTLNNASENLGGTITDISDMDTPELLTGKVENCANYGSVFADLNAGGIAGAMAVENDLDFFEDLQQYGEESLNFDSEVRAVVLNCDNTGTVFGNKQNIGGLVGGHSLGLLKQSTNTGNVEAEKANHVGGACGTSTGFVRQVNANCEVMGDSFVGGIAGSGAIVTDSLAQVKLENTREKYGNILGWREESLTKVENPIHGNYYLSVDADCGAMDGISYSGMAEPLELRDFLAIKELPDTFRTVKVRFQFDDGSTEIVSVPIGEPLTQAQIPELPQRDGYSARWDGLSETDLSGLLFDLHFTAVYESNAATIASCETWKDGRPILLLEGTFTDAAEVSVQLTNVSPTLNKNETLVKAWKINANENGTTARLMMIDDTDAEHWKLFVRSDDGKWNETKFHVDGRYLVFPLVDKEADIAIVKVEANLLIWLLGGGAVMVIGIVMIVSLSVKKKRRTGNTRA